MKPTRLVPLLTLLFACQLANSQVETVSEGDLGISVSAKIKGSPFSADVIRNEEFHLTNGKKVNFEIHGKVYRDSQGRTRTDRQWVVNGRTRIEPSMIVDPVEQVVISIEHNSRTVTISHGSKPVAPADSGTKSTAMTNVKPVREKTRLPGSEPLGTMTLEGLVAVGTRYTRGIDRTESWVSDDLPGTLLMMKSEGPQPGTVITMKLVNIKREEPDPQLFRPPADYTVRETGISVSSGNHR